jgi:DNA-binding MarR family transcriptional regulator
MCMCYTSIVTDRLHALDDLLSRVRRAIQRPEYRRRLLAGLDVPGGIPVLRLLRVVDLASAEGAPSIKEVATRLGLEQSTTSRSVDAAVRAGLLTKDACDQDLRRALLRLTPSARALLAETSARHRDLLASMTDGWDEADLDRLVELLGRLCDGFDAIEARA